MLQPLCDDKCDGPTEFFLLTTQHARHGAPITLDNVVWASDERDYAAVAAPSKGGDMGVALQHVSHLAGLPKSWVAGELTLTTADPLATHSRLLQYVDEEGVVTWVYFLHSVVDCVIHSQSTSTE